MKSLLCVLFVVVCGSFFSQNGKLSIKFNCTDVHVKSGRVDYMEVINTTPVNSDTLSIVEKIYDLDLMIGICKEGDNVLFEGKIEDVQINEDGKYILTFCEFDIRNGENLKTQMIIDVKNKTSFYTWYYDGEDDKTFVVKESLLSASIDK